MELTQEEIVKANTILKRKALSCNPNATSIDKHIIKALDDNMTSEQFENDVLNKLDYENKFKLKSSLRQAKYAKENPTKNIKLKEETALKLKEQKPSNMTIDEYINSLLDK